MVKIENEKTCGCCSKTANSQIGRYICYCSQVTAEDIQEAIMKKGASSVAEVIRMTRASTCCYPDIEAVFEKYRKNLG